MSKKFTAEHQNGPSRVFVSQDKSGNYISSVLYKKSEAGSFDQGNKITEYDIKHFLAGSEKDAIDCAKKWIASELGEITSFVQDS